MKIIMNNINTATEAQQAFYAVERAIEDNIKQGRLNFFTYTFSTTNNTFSVHKNKHSFSVFYQKRERKI